MFNATQSELSELILIFKNLTYDQRIKCPVVERGIRVGYSSGAASIYADKTVNVVPFNPGTDLASSHRIFHYNRYDPDYMLTFSSNEMLRNKQDNTHTGTQGNIAELLINSSDGTITMNESLLGYSIPNNEFYFRTMGYSINYVKVLIPNSILV